MSTLDYLIVGGGTAGSALAARLSDDPAVQVALLEAGPAPSRRRPRPAWRLPTVAQPGLNGRVVALMPGKGLGGPAAWAPGEGAPPAERPNLQVITDALAVRVLLQGRRAVGVEFHHKGLVQQLRVQREVVLCAGALQSPLLLMRSGIGPHAQLVYEGVAPRLDLAGVGLRLHVPVQLRLPVRAGGALAALGLRWPRRIAPPAVAGEALPAGVRLDSLPDAVLVTLPYPASRGSLGLDGKDPEQPPRLDPDLLSDRDDVEALLQGVRQARALLATQGLHAARNWARLESDLALERLVRDLAEPGPGAAGSCRMGDGPLDVVDAELRVRGITGLRVADASVLPALPEGDGHAALALLAEQATCWLQAAPPGGG